MTDTPPPITPPELTKVEIATDGACKGNPGPGGWGALIRSGGTEKELSGGEKMTTAHGGPLCFVMRNLGVLGGALQGLIQYQRADMGGDRRAKRIQVIAALQH